MDRGNPPIVRTPILNCGAKLIINCKLRVCDWWRGEGMSVMQWCSGLIDSVFDGNLIATGHTHRGHQE
jgi:hypothetical protein